MNFPWDAEPIKAIIDAFDCIVQSVENVQDEQNVIEDHENTSK